jgi:hypothetical protein
MPIKGMTDFDDLPEGGILAELRLNIAAQEQKQLEEAVRQAEADKLLRWEFADAMLDARIAKTEVDWHGRLSADFRTLGITMHPIGFRWSAGYFLGGPRPCIGRLAPLFTITAAENGGFVFAGYPRRDHVTGYESYTRNIKYPEPDIRTADRAEFCAWLRGQLTNPKNFFKVSDWDNRDFYWAEEESLAWKHYGLTEAMLPLNESADEEEK